ncbi:hypothetical protein F4803DRAFT_571963 [Xylaria telfairii]|nr:hypothetical protein F4803DRAFT_571963 [Xylaria telfairii]
MMDSNRSKSSRTLRSSSSSTQSTFIPTPSTSTSSGTALPGLGQPMPSLPIVPSGPLPVTALSATSWRTKYPRIGQFAMTEQDEIIAAVPSGLLYFKRINDHVSKPWSEGRLLPNSTMLNDSSVSGLAAILTRGDHPRLCVYCASGGTLHSFILSTKDGSLCAKDSNPPFPNYTIGGTPAVAFSDRYRSQRWNLVVPCQSGGLLHTSTNGPSSDYYYNGRCSWEPVNHIAKDLGIISSISIATVQRKTKNGYGTSKKTHLVMVCVASGRLHTAEGELSQSSSLHSNSPKWEVQAPTRIMHPGEVTGNPMLISAEDQLDLLVPSAEGGIFHFVQPASAPDEWHMIARIGFPPGLPAASCFAVHPDKSYIRSYDPRRFRALIQSGGQLYYVTTTESSEPWSGSYLRPILSPGPFYG